MWQGTLKKVKMRKAHCKTWNITRKLKKVENEQQHSLTWNMAGKTLKRGK